MWKCAFSLALVAACSSSSKPAARPEEPPPTPAPAADYGRVARADFNRRAAEHALPLFWRTDANNNGAIDPDELVGLWGWDGPALEALVADGKFTPAFAPAYELLTRDTDVSGAPADDRARRKAILAELAQGRPTLVETDLRAASAEDRAIVDHILRAAVLVERVYARENGVLGLDAKIPRDDPASRMVFFRNQGPTCEAPRTENDPDCTAVPGVHKPASGLYPEELQALPGWCDLLAKQKNAAALTSHFSVVVPGKTPGTYDAVPFSTTYREDMEAIAKELDGAAAAITSAEEQPFAAYLRAAAGAFRTNDWESADVAWAAMGAQPSRWYLRIGPDEVYYEPCALKAGFHVSFAYINPGSVAWREKLEPVKQDMEAALAALAGAPYKARKVAFRLPDFIDIILNAGNSRSAFGATIGQSLPNWGKVAEAGGRTVAMTNLYTDADSAATLVAQSSSLFCPATQARMTTDPAIGVMTTVLHEAAHNLGPSHDYKVGGKTDDAVFGGPLASMLEELKAQTAALYFTDWLARRGLITADEAAASHVRDVVWAFGHIAQGMYTGTGSPKAYSQLASIQLGTLRKAGVLTWKADELAANGTDRGCFDLDLAAWPKAVDTLAARVLRAKARGDKKDALAMKATFVDADDDWAALRGTIAERWLRAPKASFVYSLRR
ncbi:MAG TPA: hypothetical protein VM734_32105 [Kofleriaceae bacterium]|nr:hypothetical protein [Kofleriaceae bacterium]